MCLCIALASFAQKPKETFSIAFYNTENLFDTVDDRSKQDEDFLPTGRNHYTREVYQQKLNNIAGIISNFDTNTSFKGPVLVGLAEVENDRVLTDLISQPQLRDKQYGYVWFDGPDLRGIDPALLYDKQRFKVLTSNPVRVYLAGKDGSEPTRDILFVTGLLNADTLHVLVNHWPSRRGGTEETEYKRTAVAKANKHIIDSIITVHRDAKIILMGDLNDNPISPSVTKHLNTTSEKRGASRQLFNPWIDIYRAGKGTCAYDDKWNLYDQILLSKSMVRNNKWHFTRAEIYDKPFLRQSHGKYKGYPHRSFSGYKWMNGYSDHFPVLVHFTTN